MSLRSPGNPGQVHRHRLEKAERLEDLINEFFDITRFNLSRLELERQSVDLTRMLEQVASEFRPISQNRGCHAAWICAQAALFL